MDNNPLISVVVPLYNSQETIESTFNSIITQSYSNKEIIFIDDGSEDNTADIISQFTSQYDNVHYYYKENGGVASARNFGINKSKGEFIAFCDHDDLWLPNKLDEQIKLFEDSNVGLVYTGSVITCLENNVEVSRSIAPAQFFEGYCFYQLLQKNFIPSSSVIIRKSCLEKTGYFNEDRRMHGVDDKNLWLRISYYYKINAVKQIYEQHVLTGRNWSLNEKMMLESSIYCLDNISQLFPPKTLKARSAFKRAYIETYAHYGKNLFNINAYAIAKRCFFEGFKRSYFRVDILPYLIILLFPDSSIDIIRVMRRKFSKIFKK